MRYILSPRMTPFLVLLHCCWPLLNAIKLIYCHFLHSSRTTIIDGWMTVRCDLPQAPPSRAARVWRLLKNWITRWTITIYYFCGYTNDEGGDPIDYIWSRVPIIMLLSGADAAAAAACYCDVRMAMDSSTALVVVMCVLRAETLK